MMMPLSRGERNNNPTNIRRGAQWQGLAQPHQMTPEQRQEKEFAVFLSPEWGLRATVKLLHTYRDKYGLDTVAGIIGRWAPPSENKTESYILSVCKSTGFQPDAKLNLDDAITLRMLLKAIVMVECGKQPYGDAVYMSAIALAGMPEPKLKPIAKSKEIAAAVAGTATIAVNEWSGALADTFGMLPQTQAIFSTWAPKIAIGIFLAVLANRVWARVKGER